MINTKGPRNIHVVARNNVPVSDICDCVAEHKPLDWIMSRYLVTEDEVFECIDAYIDFGSDPSTLRRDLKRFLQRIFKQKIQLSTLSN